MQIKCQKDQLLKGLSYVTNIVNEKPSISILSNILINASDNTTQLAATDLKISVEYSFLSDVPEAGSITVPAKKMQNIIRELPNDLITIKADEQNNVEISCGKSKYKIIGVTTDEFPTLPKVNASKIQLPQKMLKDVLSKTTFSMSNDASRYVLNGLFCSAASDEIIFVSTDCRRMSMITKKIKTGLTEEKKFIIPSKMVSELMRVLNNDGDLFITIGAKELAFNLDELQYVCQLIDGHYPNYKQVIPENDPLSVFSLNINELYSIIRRASVLMDKNISRIKLDFNDNKINFSANVPELGDFHESIDTPYEKDQITMGFNPQYFMDILKNVDTEDIQFKICCYNTKDTDKKVGILTTGQDDLFLIMPMELI